jgi:hypothetical protein
VGVELRHQNDLVALEALAHHAPLRGAVHQRGDRQEREGEAHALAPLGQILGLLRPLAREHVDAAAQREQHVLVLPDDTLRHAGRAAGVEDVVVGAGSRTEVPLWRALREGVLVVAADDEPVAHARHVRRHALDPLGERRVVDERLQVGVAEQVGELVGDVAVVDVDPDRPELEHGPQALDPLDGVDAVDAHVVARSDALGGEVVGEAVGACVHLGVGAALAVGHQVLAVAPRVGGVLEQVGQVELHRPPRLVRASPRGFETCSSARRWAGLRSSALEGLHTGA